MTVAGIYVRISDDAQSLRAGVERQLEDCRRLCEQLGWVVAGVYEDNDRSAFQGRARPGYERLLCDMQVGAVQAVAVWHLDRLTRHPRELEDFMEAANARGVELATATGEVDLSTGDGRLFARMMGAVAAKESDDKSRRILRKHEELARAGKVSGGGWRPFGYEADRRTLREDEADLIQDAAGRLLAGESMRSVLRDWEAEGVTSPAGKPWSATSLKRVMRSARIVGLREHRGEIAGTAEWPPIIDEATHHRLLSRLKGTGEGRMNRQRRYLLTGGLAVCGRCGAALVAQPRADGRPSMVCRSGPGDGGCGRIRVQAEPLEDLIGQAVIEALDSPALIEALRAHEEDDAEEARLTEQIRAWQDQLEQAAADYYTAEEGERIGRAEFFAARKALEGRIDQAKARLSRNGRNRILVDLPAGRHALEQAWEQGDVGWRRALVAAIVDRIEINPATRGRNRFDPGRVGIIWRA